MADDATVTCIVTLYTRILLSLKYKLYFIPGEGTSSTCATTVLRNSKKCMYKYSFLKINQYIKGQSSRLS